MKFVRILFFLLLLPSSMIWGREINSRLAPTDSTINHIDSTKFKNSNDYYDALLNRTQKSKLSKLIINSILVDTDWKNPKTNEPRLIQEENYFNGYKGKKIAKIEIFRTNVFSPNDSIKRSIENLHVLTRRRIIRRNLFFKEGQKLDPEVMIRNEQYLRSLPYLADAYILIQENENKDLDVFIYTRDNLSFSPGFTLYDIDKMYGFLQETNFMGSGNRFEAGIYVNLQGSFFRGHRLEYTSLNLMGSFATLDLLNYRDFHERMQRYSLNKEFISPLDFAGGVNYQNYKYDGLTEKPDSIVDIESQLTDFWAGISIPVYKNRDAIYFTSRYLHSYYPKRFAVSPTFNPAYHERKVALFSTGIYREGFYRGSLIYGFGRSEDIPYGYKFELIGGRSWEEFTNRWYMGASLQGASITPFGYFGGKSSIGSYYNDATKSYKQSVVSAQGLYFSNLGMIQKWGFRYFLWSTYRYGFNRMTGDGETLMLNSNIRPRGISDDITTGRKRFTISTEGVAFAPFYVMNFRFAFFGYSDWSWLGDHTNMFDNDYCSTVGFGVRIKNERLIFQTIQIRLGFAITTTPNTKVNWLDISDETRMRINRIIPGRADFVEFR